jgi:hypothetical protein
MNFGEPRRRRHRSFFKNWTTSLESRKLSDNKAKSKKEGKTELPVLPLFRYFILTVAASIHINRQQWSAIISIGRLMEKSICAPFSATLWAEELGVRSGCPVKLVDITPVLTDTINCSF